MMLGSLGFGLVGLLAGLATPSLPPPSRPPRRKGSRSTTAWSPMQRNGRREIERRLRQIQAGRLKVANGLHLAR